MYNTILFDLDGTLTDPKEGITKCAQYALKYLGVDEPDLDSLTKFIGPPIHVSCKLFWGFDEEQTQVFIKKYRERFSSVGIFENKVYEGIHEMLRHLKSEGKILAVATSKLQIYAERILDEYHLTEYFDVIVGSELDGTRSSKDEVIQEVLAKLQLMEEDKRYVVMVGDRKHDIVGAKTTGIDSIGVAFGYAEEGELVGAEATYVVDSVEQLTKFLVKE